MVGFRNVAGILLLFTVLIFAGIRSIRTDGGVKEAACYAALMLWCAYMGLAAMFNWMPLNTAELRRVVYSPVGEFMERLIFKEQPAGE
jgi:hypothetical protein